MKAFPELSTWEIETFFDKREDSALILKEQIFFAEADVFLCVYLGRRVNIKIDLDYGAEVNPVDVLSADEIKAIEKLLLSDT